MRASHKTVEEGVLLSMRLSLRLLRRQFYKILVFSRFLRLLAGRDKMADSGRCRGLDPGRPLGGVRVICAFPQSELLIAVSS